jgi:hypothetical protein
MASMGAARRGECLPAGSTRLRALPGNALANAIWPGWSHFLEGLSTITPRECAERHPIRTRGVGKGTRQRSDVPGDLRGLRIRARAVWCAGVTQPEFDIARAEGYGRDACFVYFPASGVAGLRAPRPQPMRFDRERIERALGIQRPSPGDGIRMMGESRMTGEGGRSAEPLTGLPA